MINKVRLDFRDNAPEDGFFKVEFFNTTRKYNNTYVNFYCFRDYRKIKKIVDKILLESKTLKEVELGLNKIGFYLYLFKRVSPNINYFFIIANMEKNKIIYNNKATLMYINDNIDIIDNNKKDILDLSDLD